MERESSVKISATVYKQLEEQTKTVAYTDNGTYNVSPDPGYWLSNVNVEVHVDQNLSVISELSAVISGLNDQIANISTLSVTENGTYIPEPDTLGWNNVEVNVAGGGGSGQKPVFKIKNSASLRTNETELPFEIDSSEVTNFSYMFSECNNLKTIPQLDTSNGTNFSAMFQSCFKLITIPQLDVSNGFNLNYMTQSCNALENITFIGSINLKIDFQYSSKLTYESVKSILTACSNPPNTNAKTLKFNRTLTDQDGELDALIATCTSKGWTITGLTLN